MSKEETGGLRLIEGGRPLMSDDAPRFVRVTERNERGWVHFDFAVGTPDMFVELVLPEAAFEQFCEVNNVTHMTEEQSQLVDEEVVRWRYGEEGQKHKRGNQSQQDQRDD